MKMKRMVLLALVFCGGGVWAAAPSLINYQGFLQDNQSTPLNGTYDMIFRMYTAETGGTAFWQEQHLGINGQGITVTGGYFSATLGGVTVLDASTVANSSAVWLETVVSVSGSPTTFPRQRLVSAPFAVESARLGGKAASDYATQPANVLTVAKSGGMYTSISAAASAAASLATANNPITIFIYPGVYEGQIMLPSYVSLVGCGRDQSIISVSTSGWSGLDIDDNKTNVSIRSLRIQNGNYGIFIRNSSNVFIDDVYISSNATGIAANTVSQLKIQNSVLYHNGSLPPNGCGGAGIVIDNVTTLEIRGCYLEGNASGFAAYHNGTGLLMGNRFLNNSCVGNGSEDFFIENVYTGTLVFTNNILDAIDKRSGAAALRGNYNLKNDGSALALP